MLLSIQLPNMFDGWNDKDILSSYVMHTNAVFILKFQIGRVWKFEWGSNMFDG